MIDALVSTASCRPYPASKETIATLKELNLLKDENEKKRGAK